MQNCFIRCLGDTAWGSHTWSCPASPKKRFPAWDSQSCPAWPLKLHTIEEPDKCERPKDGRSPWLPGWRVCLVQRHKFESISTWRLLSSRVHPCGKQERCRTPCSWQLKPDANRSIAKLQITEQVAVIKPVAWEESTLTQSQVVWPWYRPRWVDGLKLFRVA